MKYFYNFSYSKLIGRFNYDAIRIIQEYLKKLRRDILKKEKKQVNNLDCQIQMKMKIYCKKFRNRKNNKERNGKRIKKRQEKKNKKSKDHI
ncbi:unnamed protein product [Paramecium primaurelia]|uniref:Uncharacterized protein n=1 Tax=Paramecium primaurelia TaxID=5886 RepID=A0A8S1PCX7_PARPR|nr:unnamed protein product [Paramecium primaurelia]